MAVRGLSWSIGKIPHLKEYSNKNRRALFTHWRPLSGYMYQYQHPYNILIDCIHQTIIFMRYQLAGAGYLSRFSQLGMLGQTSRSNTKKLIYSSSSTRIFSCNVIPNIYTVLQRFRCPFNLHAAFVARARLATNLDSTSAFVLP